MFCRANYISFISGLLTLLVAGSSLAAGDAFDPTCGARVYRNACAGCHGAVGGGDGPVSPWLPKRPANLESIVTAFRLSQPSQSAAEGLLEMRLAQGVPDTGMPPMADLLNDRELRCASEYLLSNWVNADMTGMEMPRVMFYLDYYPYTLPDEFPACEEIAGRAMVDGECGCREGLVRSYPDIESSPCVEPGSLDAVLGRVFHPECVHCHNGERGPQNLRLESPQTITQSVVGQPSALAPEMRLVAPGDPQTSYLYQVLIERPGVFVKHRMPFRAPPLSAEQQELVRKWIENGAPTELSGGRP